MLYEVITPSGASYIDADNSRQAKAKTCKALHIKPSDYWNGTSSMKAQKFNVGYPEVFYRPLTDDKTLQPFIGKNVLLYDEHHETAALLIRKATIEQIRHFMDEYTSIIVL
jgi:hypothetical protein